MVDFTKSDLKTGMVVESRNGDKYLVIRGDFYAEFYSKQKIMFIANNYYMPGTDYDSLLKTIDGEKDYDIVKVYKPDIYSLEGTFENCNDSNLIWEREPEVDWSEVPVGTKIFEQMTGIDIGNGDEPKIIERLLNKTVDVNFYCARIEGYTILDACEKLCPRYSSCDTVAEMNDVLKEYEDSKSGE